MKISDIQENDIVRIIQIKKYHSATTAEKLWCNAKKRGQIMMNRSRASILFGREVRVIHIMSYMGYTYFHVCLLENPTITGWFPFELINHNGLWRNMLYMTFKSNQDGKTEKETI